MIDGMADRNVLVWEVLGFIILGFAAQLEYFFQHGEVFPTVLVRTDMMHTSDSLGLFLLTLVAIAHYQSKVSAKKFLEENASSHLM